MTLPPPALSGLLTGNRGTRRRAPVNDHPESSPVTGTALMCSSLSVRNPVALPECVYYIGIDWGSTEHAVCVIDQTGRMKTRFTVAHTAAGFTNLTRRLGKLGEPELMPIGIERPDGRLVDVLLEAGHPVVPVKPNAIKAWRDAEVLSGAKSDAADAQVIAEYLRLRQHRLTPARPYSDQTKALRTVVRTRDDIVKLRVMATNMLSALLETFWPGAKAVSQDGVAEQFARGSFLQGRGGPAAYPVDGAAEASGARGADVQDAVADEHAPAELGDPARR